jgi:hypothetical protein
MPIEMAQIKWLRRKKMEGNGSDFARNRQGPPGARFFLSTMMRSSHSLGRMSKTQIALFAGLAATLALAGCSGSNALDVGTPPDATNNGSYSGSTLNSPVADQNPHPGGDPSYPSSVSDQGVVPPPPEKSDGR